MSPIEICDDNKSEMSETDKAIEKLWNEYSEVYPYLEHSTAYKELLESILELLDQETPSKILELGAGTGNVTHRLIKKFPESAITVVENNPNMGIHLKNRFPGEAINLVEQNIGDGLDFGNDQKFDIVIANLVLPYIHNFRGKKGIDALYELLKSIQGILNQDGTLVWSSPKKDVQFSKVFLDALLKRDVAKVPGHSARNGVRFANRIYGHSRQIARLGKKRVFTFLSPEEISDIMKRSGFTDVNIIKSFAGQANIISGKKV